MRKPLGQLYAFLSLGFSYLQRSQEILQLSGIQLSERLETSNLSPVDLNYRICSPPYL